jgi:hypothetical protein
VKRRVGRRRSARTQIDTLKEQTLNRKLVTFSLILALVSAFVIGTGSAAAQQGQGGLVTPVAGTVTQAGATLPFTGTFTIERFARQGGQLVATGTLRTTVAGVTQTFTNVVVPVTSITATCQILHLVLGPVDLNLAGLLVHLDMVVLDISAAPGGGLLGSLLAGLLCSTNPSQLLINLLNQLL